MSGSQDEIPPLPPPPSPSSSQTPSQPTPHTVSTIKLLILKKGEYDIWAMKMEHYLAHTDYPIWEKYCSQSKREKRMDILLMALPEISCKVIVTDAKEMWDAIKSRFGGNDESKKMQKYILKQQVEGFSISNTEGLHKGYDSCLNGYEDLKQIDEYDLEEMDLKVASSHDPNENEKVLQEDGNQDNRREDAWNLETRRERTERWRESKALGTEWRRSRTGQFIQR
ncbi:hypothetical protein Tco_1540433 [Tanacetum coccineum]